MIALSLSQTTLRYMVKKEKLRCGNVELFFNSSCRLVADQCEFKCL